ncbi:FadR/GntR family transcriptional regulator [Actinophytocola glycyrrhizae]|uniref:FadR/GntR family transcriptional regulator n=1 Tax=Actinophytocola glycyrrhizae TaxID=2044873 RepID=A0ABV9S9D8_9PSEU
MPRSQHRPRGVHGQTVETLAGRILSGEYPEGTVLDLPTLRTELDLSLTALREALKVLTAKGMVDARQKRGTFVRPRSSYWPRWPPTTRWRRNAPCTHCWPPRARTDAVPVSGPRPGWSACRGCRS